MIDIEIAKRVKQVRENEKLTQKDFGSLIGVTRDVIGNIEYARVEAKEYIIKLIVSKFNVNEIWLRTGEGEMYNLFDEENELEYLIGALGASDDKFKRKFITFMLKRPNEDWDMIERLIEEFNNYLNKK